MNSVTIKSQSHAQAKNLASSQKRSGYPKQLRILNCAIGISLQCLREIMITSVEQIEKTGPVGLCDDYKFFFEALKTIRTSDPNGKHDKGTPEGMTLLDHFIAKNPEDVQRNCFGEFLRQSACFSDMRFMAEFLKRLSNRYKAFPDPGWLLEILNKEPHQGNWLASNVKLKKKKRKFVIEEKIWRLKDLLEKMATALCWPDNMVRDLWGCKRLEELQKLL